MNKTIIISLTTISSRLNQVHHVIQSLLNQNINDAQFEVRLHLSKEAYLLDEGCPTLTDELSELLRNNIDQFTIQYVPNSGPYRKIIPVLNEVYDYQYSRFINTLIVTADDDTIYPSWWLKKLYDFYLKYKCIIGFRGRAMSFSQNRLLPYRKWTKNISENPSLNIVPTGKDGVLYSPTHLHPDVRDIDTALSIAPKADDIWLKAHSLLLGIPAALIHTSLEEEFPSVNDSEPEISLYRSFNKRGGNDEAIDSYEKLVLGKRNLSYSTLCSNSHEDKNKLHYNLCLDIRRKLF